MNLPYMKKSNVFAIAAKFYENGPSVIVDKDLELELEQDLEMLFFTFRKRKRPTKMKWFSFYFKCNTLCRPAASTYRVRSDW